MKNKNPTILAFAWSLVINQLFAILISLLINTVINFFAPNGASVIVFALSASVYFSICYVDSWQRGNADTNRIRLNLMKKNDLKGVWAGLMAMIPSFVLATGAVLAETGVVSFREFLGVDIFTALNRFWLLPLSYLYNIANEYPVFNYIIPLFVPFSAELGYVLGRHDISLKNYFMYRDNSEEN